MTDLLDTSVLVRYLVRTPPEQAAEAARLIESGEPLAIPIVALAETAFVLTSFYQVEREHLVDVLVKLLARTNLSVLELPKDAAIEALLLCRPSRRISFADALIWAAARSASSGRVYTFDQRFPAVGVERELLA